MNKASEKAKKLKLFGYPSIFSLVIILFGVCTLFREFNRDLEDEPTHAHEVTTDSSTGSVIEPTMMLILLYTCSALFTVCFLIWIICFLPSLLERKKLPKLFLRTPNGSFQPTNGSENRPLISDV